MQRKARQLQEMKFENARNGVRKYKNTDLEEMWKRKMKLSAENEKKVWQALGECIHKALAAGRGIQVPKLGTFTFSQTEVDLYGTTNTLQRDKQERQPVFLINKDFAGSYPLAHGIVNWAGQLVQKDQHGSTGIIPTSQVNFFELAAASGLSKDVFKTQCELVLKDLADKVRKGESVTKEVPKVGTLKIRNKVAGVQFDSALISQAKGQTTKAFANKLFQVSNLMN